MLIAGMHGSRWAAMLLAAAVAVPAAADDVHLTNGEVFEQVIAVEEADSVRVRLSFGEIVLPRSAVARIERARAPLEEYLERRDALRREPGAGAAEWLELASWASVQGLEHGRREALETAADLDPHLPGLAPAMRRLGYVFDEARDRWRPYEEPRPVVAAAAEHPAAEPARVDDDAIEERLSRAVELLALAQLEREVNEGRRTADGRSLPPVHYAFPVATYGGFYFPPSPHDKVISDPVSHRIHRPAHPAARDIVRSQPGSLLPIRGGGGTHRGGFVRH